MTPNADTRRVIEPDLCDMSSVIECDFCGAKAGEHCRTRRQGLYVKTHRCRIVDLSHIDRSGP